MTPTIESALKCAQIAKEAAQRQVIMGGPHATFADIEILSSEKAVDVIVRGEGEETIVELAKQTPLGDIKGISFRKDDEIIQTPTRPSYKTSTRYHRPAYKYLPMEKYNITGRNLLP